MVECLQMAEKKRNRTKIRPKNFGAGRPQAEFPDVMRPAVVAITLNGGTVDDCRDFLKKSGFNITRASILAVMATAGASVAPTALTSSAGMALDDPAYDDVRVVIDDFVRENRSAARIRAWLQMTGYDPPCEQDVEDYATQRRVELSRLDVDPAAREEERVRLHARSLRAKAAEVWRRMPVEEKYSQRVFLGLASELAAAEKQLADAQQKRLAASDADETSVRAELERKLGIAIGESAPGVPAVATTMGSSDAAPALRKVSP